jgi:hypothetical protein
MDAFTWLTSTSGGFRAVSEFKDKVRHARRIQQNDNIFPLVTLGDVHMKTQFGGRQRPHLNVVRYVALGGAEQKPLLETTKTEPMNDSIPY